MKKTKCIKQSISLLFLIFNLTVFASNTEYTINGKIINYENFDVASILLKATKVTPSGQVSESIKISKNGEFTIKGKCFKKLNQIWLAVDDIYYGEILVSSQLIITLDYCQLSKSNVSFFGDGVQFGGIDSEATIISNKWINFRRTDQQRLNSQIQIVSRLNISEFEKVDRLNKLFKKREEFETEFLSIYPNDMAWILADKRNSEYYSQLFLLIDKQNINWEILDEAMAFSPNVLGNSSYQFYKYQSWVLGESYIGSNIFKNWENQERNLNKLTAHNKDFLILSAIPDNLEWKEQYATKFLPYVNQAWVKEYLKELMVQSKININEINTELSNSKYSNFNSPIGKSHREYSFGAQSFISEQNDALSFIKAIQKNFVDKAIIIDLWATWCKPCISDMKKGKRIKKELENLPLVIVYVCTEQGSSVENWEMKIADLKTQGTHIFINKKLTTSFMDKFKLNGYPSYLFFDSNGVYKKDVVEGISNLDIEKLKSNI
ncbi:TlpA family protein disulfide reductase [Portibacter lacus]|nr:hypothetical protein [Portibacter lacus]